MLLTADKMFFNGPYGNGDELGTAQFMVNMMISIDGIYRSTDFNGETQVCFLSLLSFIHSFIHSFIRSFILSFFLSFFLSSTARPGCACPPSSPPVMADVWRVVLGWVVRGWWWVVMGRWLVMVVSGQCSWPWLCGGWAVAARWLRRGCAVTARWLCRGCTVTVSWDTALPWLAASLAAGRALNAGCGRVPDRRGQPRPG